MPSEATLVLLLGNALRMLDRLAQVAAVLAEGVTTEGSKGQVRAHPLLGVEAMLQREWQRRSPSSAGSEHWRE